MSRILLVEDNAMNSDMLSRHLLHRNYEVVVAVDGSEALAKARTEHPDLILMDVNLPDIDGLEVTRQLRAEGGHEWLPVIALTANAFTSDRQKALEAGCNGFLSKPVEIGELIEMMENLLEKGRCP